MRQAAFTDAQAALPFVVAQGRNVETRIYQKRYPAYNYAQVKLERKLNGIAFTGATEKNWTGFANSADVPRADVAASATAWGAKTADQKLTDVNEVIGRVRTQTNEVEWADSLALPPDAFRAAATQRLGAGDGFLTVLEYIRKNNIYTAETGQELSIYPVRELATASIDGGGRMVAYRRDEEVVRFHLPMPRTVLQARQKSIMGFETGIIARTGGTEWRLPKAAAYADKVTAVPA